MKDLVNFIRMGSETERFHSVKTLTHETVGHHSFNVAWLCWVLAGRLPSAELIMAALAHDLAEHVVGDIPSPSKRAMDIREAVQAYEDNIMDEQGLPTGQHLPDHERRILALADCLDGMMSCQRERALGNRLITPVYVKFRSYAKNMGLVGKEKLLFTAITSMWEDVDR